MTDSASTCGVEPLVVVPELLEVREVPRSRPVAEGDHQAGPVAVPADPGGGLDVLSGVLRLADDQHQAEPGDVHAHLQHRGGEHYVERTRVRVRARAGRREQRASSPAFPAAESNRGSNGTAIWSSVAVMSALATREVSSATLSWP